MSLQPILDDCGFTITRYQQVFGGDINQSYCLYSNDERYFLKVNDAGLYPAMFVKEAGGLIALATELSVNELNAIAVPQVIKQGTTANKQYLLLEWLEKGRPNKNFWEEFGSSLANLHKKQQTFFGWHEDNYIGNLVQQNTKHGSWHSFYAECRIMPLVKELYNAGSFSKQDVTTTESFCKKINDLFPHEPPALLHGDLWSGNFMIAQHGNAAIYDPAVYYGHREMDIGMTKLFGGFDSNFYSAYHAVYPLEKNWQQRLSLTQLYPLLVHAVLFGGHYVSSARNIIQQFA